MPKPPPRSLRPTIAQPVAQRWREELRAGRAALRAAFRARADTSRLLRGHARLVDRALAGIWTDLGAPADAALVAVGGYGRGELFPHSDVDVLILLPGALDAAGTAFVERLVGVLWDAGLETGHSVRTIAQCVDEMAADVTITTSLLEHRFVAGSRRLHRAFGRDVAAAMDVPSFYEAKVLEQQQRHLKYHDTAYNLEPNVKESPGGLRDLHTVLWIARAAGLGRGWRDLAQAGLITLQEARTVSRQERLDRRAAGAAPLPRGPARGSARLRPAKRARARPRARRHARPASERAADAALLPRGEDGAAGQRHPAAEPACPALPDRDRARAHRRRFPGDRRAAARPRRGRCSKRARRRCSTRS